MKSYKIRGKTYFVGNPKTGKLSVRQYEMIHALLKETGTGIPIELEGEGKVEIAVGYFLGSLMESRAISRFFALILTPEGEEWTEEVAVSKLRIDEVSLAEEDVFGEVTSDFFTSRVAFANALGGAFNAFMIARVKSTKSSSEPTSPSSTSSPNQPGASS